MVRFEIGVEFNLEERYYREMVENCQEMEQRNVLNRNKKIFLFGHCNATEELAEFLLEKGYTITAILDNSTVKQGKRYHDIPILSPKQVLSEPEEQVLVCIVTRFYASMVWQLRQIGFHGDVRKLVDYNTYAEYSLSHETMEKKQKRIEFGKRKIEDLKRSYPDYFRIFCPFAALGDVYFCMSYLPYFLKLRKKDKYLVCVVGNACARVVSLFDDCPVIVMEQKDLDAAIQAELFMQDEQAFIAHQDRPYVVNLSRALYGQKITLERIYCCGVFGLPATTKPRKPKFLKRYDRLNEIPPGKSVILSPYAKSVTAIKAEIWAQIVQEYQSKGYCCYTNVVGREMPLPGTIPISPTIDEIQSVVEWAGTFIGIRSGLCDVIKEAACKKIALYPDYYYCDTKWKAVDIYWLENWKNMVVGDDFQWKRS